MHLSSARGNANRSCRQGHRPAVTTSSRICGDCSGRTAQIWRAAQLRCVPHLSLLLYTSTTRAQTLIAQSFQGISHLRHRKSARFMRCDCHRVPVALRIDRAVALLLMLSQLADFIPPTSLPDSIDKLQTLATGLPLGEDGERPGNATTRNDGPSDEVTYDSPTGSFNFRDVLADRSFSQPQAGRRAARAASSKTSGAAPPGAELWSAASRFLKSSATIPVTPGL